VLDTLAATVVGLDRWWTDISPWPSATAVAGVGR
jgi:hypothetical protein